MPGQRCVVALCKNNFIGSKKLGLNISFYSFPKEEIYKKQWIIACCRNDVWNPVTRRICSAHFKEDDFQRNLKAELLNLNYKTFLKPTAVPSLCLSMLQAEDARDQRMQRKEKKEFVEEILLVSKEPMLKADDTICIEDIPSCSNESDTETLRVKYIELNI